MNVQEFGCILFIGVFLGGVVGWMMGSREAMDSSPLTKYTSVIEWIFAFVGALVGFNITFWMCYLLGWLP